MAVNLELLNSTFAAFKGPLTLTFEERIPLIKKLKEKAQTAYEPGTYIERTFAGGTSSRGTGIFAGDEILTLQRRQQLKKFQVQIHRIVLPLMIPKKELLQNDGKAAVIRLIKEYPTMGLKGAMTDLNKYFLTGATDSLSFAASELLGFLSLNGQVSTGIGTGVTNGLLDFAAPASQTDTVQSIAKSSSYYHYNQYADVASFAATGMKTLYSVYGLCADFGMGEGGDAGPDMIFMDPESFANFRDARSQAVRVQITDDRTEKSNLLELPFGGRAVVYHTRALDLAQFTGVAADGVTYFLDSDYLEMPLQEDPKVGDFEDKTADQDVMVAKWSMQGQLICTKFTAQGAVTGCASP